MEKKGQKKSGRRAAARVAKTLRGREGVRCQVSGVRCQVSGVREWGRDWFRICIMSEGAGVAIRKQRARDGPAGGIGGRAQVQGMQ